MIATGSRPVQRVSWRALRDDTSGSSFVNAPEGERPEEEQPARLPSALRRVERHIQGTTLSGFIELVPLLVTIVVLLFIIRHADGLIRPLAFVEGRPWDFWGIGFVVLIILFYFLGLATFTRVGRATMDFVSGVLSRVPVVKTVFGVTQQATTALTSQHDFNRVVFVEWPREGMAAMGFVTRGVHSAQGADSMVLVYIPTAPNPTSGNLALVLEDDVIETDLSVEDAMKLVFSGGIVLPEAVSLARVPRIDLDNPRIIGRFETNPD